MRHRVQIYHSICRSDSSKSRSPDVFASPVSQDKTGNSGAIVKSSNELAKTTPAGEYLTSALMDFDPDQFEGFAAIADGANKLLMLVINTTPTYIILLLDLLYLLFVATKLVLLLPLYCPRLPLYIFFFSDTGELRIIAPKLKCTHNLRTVQQLHLCLAQKAA